MRLTTEECAALLKQGNVREVIATGIAQIPATMRPNLSDRDAARPTARVDHQNASTALCASLKTTSTSLLSETSHTYRSKLELRYAQYLDGLVHTGALRRWWYEPIRLALAPRTTYTPDFLLWWANEPDRLAFHECKGWQREKAMIKLKVAAALYPVFSFRLVTWSQGEWCWTTIPPG